MDPDSGSPLFDGIALHRWFMGPAHVKMLEHLADLDSAEERLVSVRTLCTWDAVRALALSVPLSQVVSERDFRAGTLGMACPLTAYFSNARLVKRHARCARALTVTLLRGKTKGAALPLTIYNWLVDSGGCVTQVLLRLVEAFADSPQDAQSYMFAVVARAAKRPAEMREQQFRAVPDDEAVRLWTEELRPGRAFRWRTRTRSEEVCQAWFGACVQLVAYLRQRWEPQIVYVTRKRKFLCHSVRLLKEGPAFLGETLPEYAGLFGGASLRVQAVLRHFLVVWVLRSLREPMGAYDGLTPHEQVHQAVLCCQPRVPTEAGPQVSIWERFLLQGYPDYY